MIDYFLIGIKSMMKSSVLTFAIYFISFLLLLILWRRYVIVRQSGGNYFAPFHIAKGRLYIHTIILFRKRIVPLAEIRQIDIDYVRGRRMNGDRYHLYFTRKDGKSFTFHFGKSKRNEELVKNLANVAKKCHIKINQIQ